MQEYLRYAGGAVASSVLLYYAINVVMGRAKAESVASWLMWALIDSLLLATTWQANKPIWLPLGWTVGCWIIVLSLFWRGTWKWTWRETISAICVSIATFIWQNQGAGIGMIAGTSSLIIAGTPLVIEMWKNPDPKTLYIWSITAIACMLTLAGSDGTILSIATPIGSMIFNLSMCYIVSRKVI